jgi:hypothetical protein
VGQILDAKPILVFDHIPQHETKGISLHQLVKLNLMKREEIGRKEETIRRILPEDPYPPHFQQPLDGGGILHGSRPDRLNLFRKMLDFFL